VATLARHFVKHRGLATGIAIAGSSLGGVIWPIVADQLLNHHGLSFGWTLRVIAFIMIPVTALAVCLVVTPKADAEHAETSTVTAKTEKKADLSILRKPIYLVFVIANFFLNMGMFGPFFFATAYSIAIGHSASFSFYVLSIMNAASLFGRVGVGIMADKFGPFNLSSTAALLGAIVCYCWTTATSMGAIVVWAIAYGFSSGVSQFIVDQASV
jgi:Na+/melibiose symporter-like transporter